jgi:hypothetical protein
VNGRRVFYRFRTITAFWRSNRIVSNDAQIILKISIGSRADLVFGYIFKSIKPDRFGEDRLMNTRYSERENGDQALDDRLRRIGKLMR